MRVYRHTQKLQPSLSSTSSSASTTQPSFPSCSGFSSSSLFSSSSSTFFFFISHSLLSTRINWFHFHPHLEFHFSLDIDSLQVCFISKGFSFHLSSPPLGGRHALVTARQRKILLLFPLFHVKLKQRCCPVNVIDGLTGSDCWRFLLLLFVS